MRINNEKIKSCVKVAWKYYVKWAYLKRHSKLFLAYLSTVCGITLGISGFRIDFNKNPNSESFFEIVYGQIGWPEVCIAFLITIAFIFVGCLMEWKEFLNQVETDYTQKINMLFEKRLNPIRKLSNFIRTFDDKGPFETGNNKKITNVFDAIKDIIEGKYDYLYISAFSGMGKTRWVYEMFRNTIKPDDPIFYCDRVEEHGFETSFNTLIEEFICRDAIVILDDCDADIFDKCQLKIQQSKCNVRLIGLNNNTSNTPRGIRVLKFEYQDLEDVVRAIVDSRLAPRLKDAYSSKIIDYAEGIPYMAVLMIEGLNSDNEPNPTNLSRSALCKRMLHLDPNIDIDSQMKAFQSIALFSPLGYKDVDEGQFAFVRDNDNITPIIAQINRKNLFQQVVTNGINQQIIEQRATWINVRPAVLAVWLLEDWYKQCDDKRMAAITNDITNAPFGKYLIEAFCKRFEDMPESHSAQKLVYEITKSGCSFSSEDVVCSDMGSRLFLTMATVNPAAVSDCLYSRLFLKEIDWLKEHIKDGIRRNYIGALEKLCFRHESFDKAAQLLAKFAVAENENWSNNASGIFMQLFHITLAGTQATLTDRIQLLTKLANYGDEFNDAIILALNHIFNYGHFYRNGGAEKIGRKTLQEFTPTNRDVVQYWEMACDFITEWIVKHPQMIEKVADAITKQARQIGWAAGCRDILYRLISEIIKIKGEEWPEMAKELTFAEIHQSKLLSNEEKSRIRFWIDKLKKKDFISSLCEAHLHFYGDYQTFEQRARESALFFESYLNKFINERLYTDSEVISNLIDNQQQKDIFFVRLLAEKLNDEQLLSLFNTTINVIRNKNIKNSRFINQICTYNKSKKEVVFFLNNLQNNGFSLMYVSIVAEWEEQDLHILNHLIEQYGNDKEWGNLLTEYLRRSPIYDGNQMADTINIIAQMGDTDYKYIADYIGENFDNDFVKNEPLIDLVKRFILRIDEDLLSRNTSFRIINIAEQILKDSSQPEFAKQYNLKIIKKISNKPIHNDYESLYFSLLPKYEDVILNDVLDALASENSIFWMQMMNNLGSGFTTEAGPLFQCDIEKIKVFCLKHAKSDFPQRLAHMCPIYELIENNDNRDFHPIVYWFLDNLNTFKDEMAVLAAIGANMNSFSWTGSTLPIWQKQKHCFMKILNHKLPLVRDWAKRNIEVLDQEIKNVNREMSYEYFKYK